jgi:hypothetical protein
MGELDKKVSKAKNKAKEAKYYYRDNQKLANKIAKTATGQDLTMAEERRAGKIVQARRTIDTAKTVARGAGIQKMQEKKASKARMTGAVSGGAAKKAAPKKNYVTDKKTGKPLSMNTKNPQEAGVGSVGKVAIKLGTKAVKKVIKSATAKPEAKANARGLKAANKPTKAAKTGIGNNNKISVEVRRGALKNEPPARANRTRGGGMATLKRQEAETAFRAAKNKALANSAKGKLQTPTAEAAKRRNIKK